MKEKIFELYTVCKPILGVNRLIIYDLQKQNYHYLPPEILSFIKSNLGNTINEIINNDKLDESSTILDYLLKHEICFWVEEDENKYFTELSLDWEYPAYISNIIIDINCLNFNYNFIQFFENSGCKHITIYSDCLLTIDLIHDKLSYFNNSRIMTIELVLKYNCEFSINDFDRLCINNPRINKITLYEAPYTKIEKFNFFNLGNIFLTTNSLNFNNKINILNFSCNIQLFTESQLHNTYFNRKVCIDAAGNIKNSPEHERSFGNIKDTTIEEAIEKPGFKDLWFIHKEMIDVCKDCEFRHMCVDACIPLQRADGSWYRSQECNYNPYICKWDDEEGYQNLASCGVVCNADGYSIDHEKIASINQVLWEEE
jgi:SPASM domain peptide maturase of grasp-with-spasm system